MRPIKRAIILCWIMLVACFAIKLFGGNWFEVVCTNEHFSNFCKFVDQNLFLRVLIGTIMFVSSGYFIFVTISLLNKPTKKQKIIILISLIFISAFSEINITIKSALEFVVFCLIPYATNKVESAKEEKVFKKTWHLGILGYGVVFLFQFISLITRNVGIKITHDSLLITLILMIDYYIMIALCYLYVKNRKENKENG